MKYRELIELYKNGKLEGEEKEKVERDIERQDAISEYLFESGEIPGFEEHDHLAEELLANQEDDDEKRFVKMVNKTIRKAFIKMGAIVAVVVLVIVAFSQFAYPRIVDLFYYNPAEIVGVSEYGQETNRLTLDLNIYTELFYPETYREHAEVERKGLGEYDIEIEQNHSETGVFKSVYGKIDKNKMTLYDDLFSGSVGGFYPGIPGVEDYSVGFKHTLEDAKLELQELDSEERYVAYVTLSEVMEYAEFESWIKKGQLDPRWCTFAIETEEGYEMMYHMGFFYCQHAISITHDGKYENLTQWDLSFCSSEEKDWRVSEEQMTTHVVSMLRYMDEQKTFNQMMEREWFDYAYYADNVEKNGLNIFGFMMVGTKEELLNLSNVEGVGYISTGPLE